MVNLDLLNDDVVSALEKRLNLDMSIEGNEQKLRDILSRKDAWWVLNEYMNWHGLIGWTDHIINALDSAREADSKHPQAPK